MKHIIYILTLFTLLTLPAAAQKKKQETPTIDAQTYIDKYMFEKAEEVLEKEIKNLKRRRKSTQSQETKLEEIDRLRSIMSATERVTFIDSMVVSKKDFFKHIALGDECGRIIPARTFFDNQNDTTGAMIYKPEIGERIWLAKGDESGNLNGTYTSKFPNWIATVFKTIRMSWPTASHYITPLKEKKVLEGTTSLLQDTIRMRTSTCNPKI